MQSGGRSARLLELDPLYCDTIVTRWQQLTGQKAFLIQEAEPAGLATLSKSLRTGRTYEGLLDDHLAALEGTS